MRLRIRCQPCGYTCTNPLFSLLSSSALASCIALTCSLNSILTVLPPSFLSLIRKVWCIRENVQISARDSQKVTFVR